MTREPILPNDAIWLQDSASNLMVINSVITMDRVDLRTLRSTFQQRIFEGPDAPAFERFRCLAGGSGSRRYWERDPKFDLRRQIIPAKVKQLDSPEAVQAYVGEIASIPLDPDLPLWQIQVIPGLDGETVILLRFHHSLGDGEALVGLLFSLVDQPPALGARHAARSARVERAKEPLSQLFRTAAMALSAPGILLKRLTWLPDRSPMHGPALSGIKRVAWTQPLDLEVVKAANQQIGATVNDVLMASVAGAFSHYLLDHGIPVPNRFLVSMPVSVRALAKSTRCGNYFAPVPLELPAGAGVHGHRILAVKERMDEMKGSPAPLVIYHLQRALLDFLPQSVSKFIIDFLANKCSAVVTNVKGPAKALAIQGRRLRTILFWVPQRAKIGIGVSILSFNGKVQVGVIADEALMPDPGELVRAFEDEFDTLKVLAALAADPEDKPEPARPAPAAVKPVKPDNAVKPVNPVRPVKPAPKRAPRAKARPRVADGVAERPDQVAPLAVAPPVALPGLDGAGPGAPPAGMKEAVAEEPVLV